MNRNNIHVDFLVNLNMAENVYFLGLLWADGYLTRYGLGISSVKEDFESFEPFLRKMGLQTIYERQRIQNGKKFGRQSKSLAVTSMTLKSFLIEHDYDKKSFVAPIKILSKIPECLKHYWWRGYFDGDGSLYAGKRNSLAFWSTIEQDWSCLEVVFKRLGIEYRLNKYVRKNGKHKSSSLEVIKLEMIQLVMEYIYKNYNDDKIGLKRKHQKYLKILEKIKIMKKNHKNASGFKGIIYIKGAKNPWRAYIGKENIIDAKKDIMLGQYKTKEAANKIRLNYLKKNKSIVKTKEKKEEYLMVSPSS